MRLLSYYYSEKLMSLYTYNTLKQWSIIVMYICEYIHRCDNIDRYLLV